MRRRHRFRYDALRQLSFQPLPSRLSLRIGQRLVNRRRSELFELREIAKEPGAFLAAMQVAFKEVGLLGREAAGVVVHQLFWCGMARRSRIVLQEGAQNRGELWL